MRGAESCAEGASLREAISVSEPANWTGDAKATPWEEPIKEPLLLVQYNATRWNSKARMLYRFCRLYPFVCQVLEDSDVDIPTAAEMAVITRCLPPIHMILRVTYILQADLEPTLGEVLPWLTALETCLTPKPRESATSMHVKQALWEDIHRRFGENELRINIDIWYNDWEQDSVPSVMVVCEVGAGRFPDVKAQAHGVLLDAANI